MSGVRIPDVSYLETPEDYCFSSSSGFFIMFYHDLGNCPAFPFLSQTIMEALTVINISWQNDLMIYINIAKINKIRVDLEYIDVGSL